MVGGTSKYFTLKGSEDLKCRRISFVADRRFLMAIATSSPCDLFPWFLGHCGQGPARLNPFARWRGRRVLLVGYDCFPDWFQLHFAGSQGFSGGGVLFLTRTWLFHAATIALVLAIQLYAQPIQMQFEFGLAYACRLGQPSEARLRRLAATIGCPAKRRSRNQTNEE